MSDIVEQSEVFLDLLQPRRAIPMHYWSIKDKERFLSLLEEKNRGAGAHYVIERVNSSKYSFAFSDTATSVMVISLEPGPFATSANHAPNKMVSCADVSIDACIGTPTG